MASLLLKQGDKFGLLTYIRDAKRKALPSGQKPRVARCKCDCGKIKNVLLLHLVRGRTISCGQCNRQTRSSVLGDRFGTLTIIRELKDLKRGDRAFRMVEAKCDCGKLVIRRLNCVRNLKSCGCLTSSILRNNTITHGLTGTRIYSIWCNMRNRCYNKNTDGYKTYGARGIRVCKEWIKSFNSFYKWAVSSGYREDLTIDRFPNKKGDYGPDNCRWATPRQQQNNKTTNVYYVYKGERKTLAEFSIQYGFNYKRANNRIHKLKWTIEQAIENDIVDPKISASRAHKSRWKKYYENK